MIQTFFQEGEACDIYKYYRDDPKFSERKNFIEAMYALFRSYSNSNFISDAKTNFYQRLWEMHLAVTLIGKGFNLTPVRDNQLDVHLTLGNSDIWFEATFPTKGEGFNAAPSRSEYQGSIDEFTRPLIPRITNRLMEKRDQIYSKNISAPTLIALNSAEVDDLPGSDLDIIEAVLIGRGNLQINRDGQRSYTRRTPVLKANGADVPISLFEEDNFQKISAVLYRHSHPAVTPVEDLNDVLIIHNPRAIYPIDPFDLKIGIHRIWQKYGDQTIKTYDFLTNNATLST